MTNATAAAAKCSHFPPVAQPHPSIYCNFNNSQNDLKESCTDLCQAILMPLEKCLTHDPHLLIINRACFLTFLLKPSRQNPVMVVRVYSLIYFLQDFQQVAIMVRLARETRGIQLSWKYCRINLSAPVLEGSTLVPIWVDVFVTICADLGLEVTSSN